MAFWPASSLAPAERITCSTVGSAVGIAAMASAIAVMNRVSADSPLDRPRLNITIIVPSAAAPIHSVIVFSCFVSGVCSLADAGQHAGDLADLGVGSPGRHDHGAAAVGDRRVHERHVLLVARRRPRRRRAWSASFDAGVLSPVRADSSMLSALACDDPTVGGHVVAGGDQHDVAEDDLLDRDRRLDPVATHPCGLLGQRLEGVHRALGLALLPEADHGVEHRQQQQHRARAPLADGERQDRRR